MFGFGLNCCRRSCPFYNSVSLFDSRRYYFSFGSQNRWCVVVFWFRLFLGRLHRSSFMPVVCLFVIRLADPGGASCAFLRFQLQAHLYPFHFHRHGFLFRHCLHQWYPSFGNFLAEFILRGVCRLSKFWLGYTVNCSGSEL